uniref:AlNc14C21G2214 protein n=1 Tax=Albugo laibachii Nc14 TaxID=890382 RepID=F0W5P9_9STRA|nr:AlNc14C21G2214 [Albugo laibachii Nc14]|eukprot:CCA16440.1 AlNc14C21G2214 [Albugo laibachii Nc14]
MTRHLRISVLCQQIVDRDNQGKFYARKTLQFLIFRKSFIQALSSIKHLICGPGNLFEEVLELTKCHTRNQKVRFMEF